MSGGFSEFRSAKLVLADGTVYRGSAFGAETVRAGEVVFNTSMTGYQEICTDPSYAGQLVVMTYTQIGNVGVDLLNAHAESTGQRALTCDGSHRYAVARGQEHEVPLDLEICLDPQTTVTAA